MSSERRRGTLFIVSGPSGVGKTSMCRHVVRLLPDVRQSVSYTTRTPRAGEQPGREYHFIDVQEFEQRIRDGEFLEWARVHEHLYGTSRQHVKHMTCKGLDVLLAIDVQGAAQLRQTVADAVFVLLVPPSWEELAARLQHRASEPSPIRQKRLAVAREELAQYTQYDYVLVNDRLPEAVEALKTIIVAERYRVTRIARLTIETLLGRQPAHSACGRPGE